MMGFYSVPIHGLAASNKASNKEFHSSVGDD